MKSPFARLVVLLSLLQAAPALAQSARYELIEAVRKSDAPTAVQLLATGGGRLADRLDPDTGEAVLHIVAKREDLGWLALLLRYGADANVEDRDGNTPLIYCAIGDFTDGVRVLVGNGAKVDAQNRAGETALIKAVRARSATMVRLLLSLGANPKLQDNASGYSALDYARQDRRSAQILRLLETPVVKDAVDAKVGASIQPPQP